MRESSKKLLQVVQIRFGEAGVKGQGQGGTHKRIGHRKTIHHLALAEPHEFPTGCDPSLSQLFEQAVSIAF